MNTNGDGIGDFTGPMLQDYVGAPEYPNAKHSQYQCRKAACPKRHS
jgi:hypothetical protein